MLLVTSSSLCGVLAYRESWSKTARPADAKGEKKKEKKRKKEKNNRHTVRCFPHKLRYSTQKPTPEPSPQWSADAVTKQGMEMKGRVTPGAHYAATLRNPWTYDIKKVDLAFRTGTMGWGPRGLGRTYERLHMSNVCPILRRQWRALLA